MLNDPDSWERQIADKKRKKEGKIRIQEAKMAKTARHALQTRRIARCVLKPYDWKMPAACASFTSELVARNRHCGDVLRRFGSRVDVFG